MGEADKRRETVRVGFAGMQPPLGERAEIGAGRIRLKLGLDRDAVGDCHRKQPARRGIDQPEARIAVFDQRDVHGEVGALLDEFLGAVEWVDQKEPRRTRGGAVLGRLLGDDGNVWGERLQRGEDDGFRITVGLGHRARIILGLDLDGPGVARHDGGAGFGGGISESLGRAIEFESGLGDPYRRGCVSWC